ncbi:MAG: hypothetical protein RR279_07340 [Alistipes sp.]
MKSRIITIQTFILLIGSCLFFGCSREEGSGAEEQLLNGQQPVELKLQFGFETNFEMTRGSSENETKIAENDLYLLCFDAADKLAELPIQVSRVGSEYIAVLHASQGASRKIYLLANTQGAITASGINWRVGITTLNEVVNGLLTPSRILSGATLITNNLTLHPMSASTILPSITGSTIINSTGDATGQPLQLRRATVKITVKKDTSAGYDPTLDQLQLQGINLGNTAVDSYILASAVTPRSTTAHTGGGGNVETMLATADGTQSEPLYSYESAVNSTPFVVVKALFYGQICFFRLDFVRKSSSGESIKIPLLRNVHYQIIIKKISCIGFSTARDAIANKGVNTSFTDYYISDVANQDVVTNGMYAFALSNSEFITFTDNHVAMVAVTTYSHDAPATVPPGSVTVSSGLSLYSEARMPDNNGTYYWRDAIVNILHGFTAGTMTFRVGDLAKELSIKRYPALKAHAQAVQLGGAYIQAVVRDSLKTPWLQLSNDGGVTKKYSINNVGNDLRIYVPQSAGVGRIGRINLFCKDGKRGSSVIFIEQLK